MACRVRFEPLGIQDNLAPDSTLLAGLLANDFKVLKECGGRGMCATCHIYIQAGMDCLSPRTKREEKTLSVVANARPNSRLACQTKILRSGVTVEVPAGMYVDVVEDIEALIGRRTEMDLLHPISGELLVEAGKLITRSIVNQLRDTRVKVSEYLAHTQDV